MTSVWRSIRSWLGIPDSHPQRSEQAVAVGGGAVSVGLVMWVCHTVLGADAVYVVPSLGASAVLVFAVPHSVFAQPWSVLAGHLVSALIGVASYQLIPSIYLASAVAVGGAILGMHLLRCIHPPGGATALAAVIGSGAIHQLGWWYVLSPVGLNALLLLGLALVYNNRFPWRRYPVSRMRYAPVTLSREGARWRVTEEQLRDAVAQLNVLMDVDPGEMQAVLNRALALSEQARDKALPEVHLGRFYGNNRPGQQWSVRQIVDERRSDNLAHDLVIYRVVEGQGLNRVSSCTRSEFARWVGCELHPKTPPKSSP